MLEGEEEGGEGEEEEEGEGEEEGVGEEEEARERRSRATSMERAAKAGSAARREGKSAREAALRSEEACAAEDAGTCKTTVVESNRRRPSESEMEWTVMNARGTSSWRLTRVMSVLRRAALRSEAEKRRAVKGSVSVNAIRSRAVASGGGGEEGAGAAREEGGAP